MHFLLLEATVLDFGGLATKRLFLVCILTAVLLHLIVQFVFTVCNSMPYSIQPF